MKLGGSYSNINICRKLLIKIFQFSSQQLTERCFDTVSHARLGNTISFQTTDSKYLIERLRKYMFALK